MAQVQLSRVEKREALAPRREPYFESLGDGHSLGYRVMTQGDTTGSWIARIYRDGKYEQNALGGYAELEPRARYRAAREAAEKWFAHLESGGAPKSGTVADACRAYVAKLRDQAEDGEEEQDRAPYKDAEGRFTRLVYGGERRRGVDGSSVFKPDPIANIELSKLTKAHVSAWRARVLKEHTPSTFNRNATALRAALNWAKDCGFVASDQAWLILLKEIKGAGTRRDLYLDAAQRKLLLEHADAEVRPFLTLLNMIPFRPGEAADLKASNFNARTGELVIDGKTGERRILLGDAAQSFFRECVKSKLPGAWLVNRANGSQWKAWDWKRSMALAVAGARLPRNTVAMTLRHSVITDLVVGGLDIFHVAKMAGTSVKMIENHYGHLQQLRSKEALDRLATLA
jgi:site-specific recombinase XerD